MSEKVITPNQKLRAVRKYLKGNTFFKKIAEQYQVDASSVRGWVSKYKAFGEKAFKVNCSNLSYSAEFKEKVVKAYLAGEGSFRDIAIKYKIHAPATVSKWISQYNSHEKLTDSRPGGIVSMAIGNGRKTTYEERIEIVKYCIEQQRNYAETALHFKVSYQQVYSWYQKYTKGGVEVLHDRRDEINHLLR